MNREEAINFISIALTELADKYQALVDSGSIYNARKVDKCIEVWEYVRDNLK